MQHRKVYIDDWNLMEKICLVSGVLRFGDSNWSSVCELIKPKLQENRPWDWFTPEACEAQYKILHNEFVKNQGNGESPPLQIIKHLKTKCKLESQRKEEQWNKYMTLKKKLENLLKNDIESDLIDKYYEEAQRAKKEKEENLRKHEEALKKREILKTEYEKGIVNKTPNKQETKSEGSSSPVVTSPLLSSLLNNPPAVQYRPTLSTSSFIPAKNVQGTSRSSSFEKAQSFTTDNSFKDNFSQELLDQSISSSERQPNPVPSSSSTAMKKLEFPENIDNPFTPPGNRAPINDNNISVVQTLSAESSKSDSHNLENLGLISPNEEAYLSEVDIPPEAILEVIGDLKDGHISIDKLIRDLEASDEGVIIDKELTTVTVPMEEPYQIENKPMVELPVSTQPQPLPPLLDVKPDTMTEANVAIKEIDVQPAETEVSKEDKLPDIEEQMVVIEDTDKYEQNVAISETDDIANIEMSNSDSNIDIPPIKNESPHSSLSYSSTVAISVELESSFSEQKSDNETAESLATKSLSTRSSESEAEEDNKLKYAKPVVVIKRIEDSSAHHSNKNRRNKNKNQVEENIKTEPEEIASKPEQPQDQAEESLDVPETVFDQPAQDQAIVESDEVVKASHEDAGKLMKTIDGNITIEEDTSEKETNEVVKNVEPSEKAEPSIADDSDTSDKFEDALQTQSEEGNETLVDDNNITNTETDEKSSTYTELDESFDLNLTEEQTEEKQSTEETSVDTENTITEEPTIEETPPQNIPEPTPVEAAPEKESVEDIPLPETKEENVLEKKDLPTEDTTAEATQKDIDDVKSSEEVKAAPTKIIKKYGRKRRNTSESADSTSEFSIKIPPLVLQEIETLDADIEQTFTPIQNIKVEPSDTKVEDEKKEQNEETTTYEKPRTRENTPAKIKSEKRDTKTPERQVVKVLRRSTARNQSPLKRTDRESRSMENSELVKTRKKSIMLAYQSLASHKYANAFQKPITNRQVPGYENIIYKPMDLYTIKKKIDNKQITSVAEFQRDVLLMLNNAKMFNRINSQVYNMAVEVEEDALSNIQLTVKALGEGILRRIEENNEKIRKRQSLSNARKDSKLIKRVKHPSKDDNALPLKKPKLEENEDE